MRKNIYVSVFGIILVAIILKISNIYLRNEFLNSSLQSNNQTEKYEGPTFDV